MHCGEPTCLLQPVLVKSIPWLTAAVPDERVPAAPLQF